MVNIEVGRYSDGSGTLLGDGTIQRTWDGWIVPEDNSWIVFVPVSGDPVLFRDGAPLCDCAE